MQIVAFRPLDADGALPLAAAGRHRYAAGAAQVLAGEGFFIRQNPAGFSGIHQLTTGGTTAGPHVHQIIRRPHHRLLMLHYHQGIPAVRQAAHGGYQAGGIAGMQADGRFIQHKKRFCQRRAQTSGQAHALNLATGKRAGQAAGRNVAQTHLAEVSHAAAELLHGLLQ